MQTFALRIVSGLGFTIRDRIPLDTICCRKKFTDRDATVFYEPLWQKRAESDQVLRDEINIFKTMMEKINIEDFNSLGKSYFESFYLKDKLDSHFAVWHYME